MTPAEHRAAAAADLAARGTYPPSTDTYKNLTQSAIAHALTAIAFYLEPPPEPEIPGLPAGWKLITRQAPDGERRWGYQLTSPDGTELPATRCLWKTQEMALAAGITEAIKQTPIWTASDAAAWAGSGMDDQALRDNGIRG